MKHNMDDIIKIRNPAGVLHITLIEKLDNRVVTKGLGGLGSFENLRFEIHDDGYDKILSFYDNKNNNNQIFLAFNIEDKGELEFWYCEFPEGGEISDNSYKTWQY